MQQYADIYLLKSFAVNKYLHTVTSGWIFIHTKYSVFFMTLQPGSTVYVGCLTKEP